jgi:hypothetical protein
MASNILNSYIPKYLVELQRNNEDIITVRTNYFSPQGDVYELDRRALSPVLIQTTQSLQELQPITSNVYPFAIVTPIEFDGSTLIMSPSVTTIPTASQHYYTPIYFERYNVDVLASIDRTFVELDT